MGLEEDHLTKGEAGQSVGETFQDVPTALQQARSHATAHAPTIGFTIVSIIEQPT
jgi:hypothetical protein